MGNPIYITLDDMTVRDDNGESDKPTKPVEESVLNCTFREVIDMMMDTNPDPNYNHEYTINEKKEIGAFKVKYNHALSQPNSIIDVFAVNGETINGPYNLDSRLADYNSEIINVSEAEVDNETVAYQTIDLLVNVKSSGAGN